MSKKDDFILNALCVVAWLGFIGLCIETGALLVNYIYSLFKPEVVQNLYLKLDLSDLHTRNRAHFTRLYIFALAISGLKAYLFYLVIDIFTKLNLVKPFSEDIARLITRISHQALAIFVLSCVAYLYTQHLMDENYHVAGIERYWNDREAFLMMAAINYVIAQVFYKGLELQNENDLTV
jgi:hypothetical protein